MMHQNRISRRGLLATGLAFAGGCLFVGCGTDAQPEMTKQEDPNQKARESMEYYKNVGSKKKPTSYSSK